jgi:hypothetical protein
MELAYIIKALNKYFKAKYPETKGFFIGKESYEPTQLNAFKTHKVEIYFHIPGKNRLVFTKQEVNKYIEGKEEAINAEFMSDLLAGLFINLETLETYEAL